MTSCFTLKLGDPKEKNTTFKNPDLAFEFIATVSTSWGRAASSGFDVPPAVRLPLIGDNVFNDGVSRSSSTSADHFDLNKRPSSPSDSPALLCSALIRVHAGAQCFTTSSKHRDTLTHVNTSRGVCVCTQHNTTTASFRRKEAYCPKKNHQRVKNQRRLNV